MARAMKIKNSFAFVARIDSQVEPSHRLVIEEAESWLIAGWDVKNRAKVNAKKPRTWVRGLLLVLPRGVEPLFTD